MVNVIQLPTQQEVETQIKAGIERFYEELFNNKPRHVRVHTVPHAVAIITQNTFTIAEQQVMRQSDEHHDVARKMFKNMRDIIIVANRAPLVEIVEKATRVPVVCCHHDISAVTGEEVFIFSLHDQPTYRRSDAAGFVKRRAATTSLARN